MQRNAWRRANQDLGNLEVAFGVKLDIQSLTSSLEEYSLHMPTYHEYIAWTDFSD